MSILICGMEMPKSYKDIRIYADGRVVSKSLHTYGEEIATAVLVPPHGKLGDLDALIAVYERQIERHKEQAEKAAMKGAGYTNDMYIIDRNRDIIHALKAAPTIIPAEEGET